MGVSRLSTTQQQQLTEIGAYLQQVRLEQNKSLDEIATRTFIPMRLLKAIEQGQGEILPEAVFVRGFIRRFGEALDLDGTAIAREFSLDNTEPVEPPPPPSTVSVKTADLEPLPTTQPTTEERHTRRERRTHSNQFPWSTAIVFGLIALIGGLMAYGLNRRASQPDLAVAPSPEPTGVLSPSVALPSSVAPVPSQPSVVSPSPSAAAVPSPAVSPSAPSLASPLPTSTSSVNASPESTTPVSVSLNVTDRSWLRVTVDGKVAFEGILTQGAQQSWAAQQAIVIRAGNAGAVVVAPNQGAAQPMGTPGSVATRTFTPEGLQSQ